MRPIGVAQDTLFLIRGGNICDGRESKVDALMSSDPLILYIKDRDDDRFLRRCYDIS